MTGDAAMPILVELSPEKEARLTAEALLRGIAPEQYAGKLLDDALSPPSKGKLTREDLRAMLKEVGEGWENRPKLPTSAFTRESFYQDRT
jgi:hypothetical protein